MHFHYDKATFTLKATYLGGFANLKVSSLFLLCLVKDKIDVEQYEKLSQSIVIIVGHYIFMNLKIKWQFPSSE